jgi:acetoin utilization deacetylase AcuC-like enzyme
MNILFNKKFLQHNVESSAEGAYRIGEFIDQFENTVRDGEEYVQLVHSERYLKQVKEACYQNTILAEVMVTPESYEAACLAVGLTILASENNDFAIVRPPGHHARHEIAAGFCIFNNIAIATQKLVNEGKKVFILDIDGHHGDGTQNIFYQSNKVLYCSMHQEYAYPWTGKIDETGEGEGKGYTMNFPLPAGSGDNEFLSAVDIAIEIAKKFQPDVVGVSAGFDGYIKDSILDLNYSLNAYYECGYRLRQAFQNIFAVLEGGYHQDIKKCTESFIKGIRTSSTN